MRVVVVTESFLPQVNGVAGTVRRVVDRLVERDHEVLVVAPGPGPARYGAVPVARTRSVGVPGYRSFPLGLPDTVVARSVAAFRPDLVHLASPVALGALGLRAAHRLGVPAVAVYQTDVGGFVRRHGLPGGPAIDRWIASLHQRADLTLAPSRASLDHLAAMGVPRCRLWRRGVDLDQFGPAHRSAALRAGWGAGPDDLVVGYVGRLAPEKQVRRLAELAGLRAPDGRRVRLVAVGDGPERPWLEEQLPGAAFTGMLGGADLAAAFASLDVFVHTGEHETFCQTVQEAQASGVPVVVPAAGGPLDLVDHGRTGLHHAPAARDGADLARQVRSLVDDAALRRRLAVAGRAAVLDRTWPRVVDELVYRHYRDALAGARLGSGVG